MKLPYFKEMLNKKAMFFPLSTHLRKTDCHEGVPPPIEASHQLHYTRNRFNNPPEGSPVFFKMQDQLETLKSYTDNVCIKCFHRSVEESMVMWERYVPNGNGVMIRSTYARLESAFSTTDEEIISAPIRYVDHDNAIYFHPEHYRIPIQNTLVPHIIKSTDYQSEKKFRLMYSINKSPRELDLLWNKHNPPTGIFIKMNPCLIMIEVILAPNSTQRIIREVKDAIRESCGSVPVSHSNFENHEDI